MKKAIIFDVDGTVADCSHRTHHVTGGSRNWKSFFDEMDKDSPIQEIIDLNRLYYYQSQEYIVIVVTARPDDYREMTLDWLVKHGVKFHHFYMRKEGDYRADSIVKQEILDQIIAEGHNPTLVVDDRKQVVDMWRKNDIMTLHCAPDEQVPNVSKYKGQDLLHMMVGASGAGKSTYIQSNYPDHVVVSTDQIREQMFGSHNDPNAFTSENMTRLWRYTHDLVKTRLEAGLFTVLDATSIKDADRKSIIKVVPKGINVSYIVIERPLDEKLKTADWRPEKLIRRHDNTFKSNRKAIMNGDGFDFVTVKLNGEI